MLANIAKDGDAACAQTPTTDRAMTQAQDWREVDVCEFDSNGKLEDDEQGVDEGSGHIVFFSVLIQSKKITIGARIKSHGIYILNRPNHKPPLLTHV